MEEIVSKTDLLTQLIFFAICGPIATGLGAVVGTSLSLCMVSLNGWSHYLFRAFFVFFIAFICLYVFLEWPYLSFEEVVLWVLFIVPIISIFCYVLEGYRRLKTMGGI